MLEFLVARLGTFLPFGYAFTAGVATMLSPCCIAMLPTYASFYLGDHDSSSRDSSAFRRGGHAILISASVTLGFVGLFAVMGIVLSLGGQALMAAIPWVTVAIAAMLVVMGIYLLAGRSVHTSLPARLSSRIGGTNARGVRAYIVFGVAYAISALGCTIPIFLVVVGTSIATRGMGTGLLHFVTYALGMGLVITIVTICVALFKEGMNRWLRRLTPVVGRFSGVLLVLAGGYMLYYWFKVGNILGLRV